MDKKVLVNTMNVKIDAASNAVSEIDSAVDIMPIGNDFDEMITDDGMIIADELGMPINDMGEFEEHSSFTISNNVIMGIVIGICVIAGVVLGIICGKRAAKK